MKNILILFALFHTCCYSQVAGSFYQPSFNPTTGPHGFYHRLSDAGAFLSVYFGTNSDKRSREEAEAKLGLLKKNYESYQSYPDSIIEGWHNVIITDNYKFCRDAKVYVAENKIKELVVDNCIKLNFVGAGIIRKARNIVTINNFNNEQVEIADVYFIYDLDGPVLTTAPLKPGSICFWTCSDKFQYKKIMVSGVPYDGPTIRFKKKAPPVCAQEGTVTIELRPGVYKFRAQVSGNDPEGQFEIKAGECIMYQLK